MGHVHYIGFCVSSHSSLSELLSTFQQRSMLAEVWSCNSNESAIQYERTLNTVWDAVLENLNTDTRDLLNMLAFLNPDCVPENLLKGKLNLSSTEKAVYDPFRRNLLERNIISSWPSLRMHRLLRYTLLLKLDNQPEKRHTAFHNAVRLVRDAFPKRDMTNRQPQFDALWKQYMPQVLSLQITCEQSDPPIEADIEFAGLLADAGSFLWEHQLNRIAIPLLTLGEKIAVGQLQDGKAQSVHAHILNFLGILSAHESVESRTLAIERLKRVVKLREDILSKLPAGAATLEQQIDLGRAWNDLAYMYADMEEFEEADRGMTKSLELYKSLGDEKTLRFRFALQYADITVVRFGQGHLDEALDFARRSYELCKAELGAHHLECARFESQWSYVLIGTGDLHGALHRLMDVLAVRSKQLKKDNPDILTTKYWIGTVHHYLDQLEEAEQYLTEAIEFGTDSGLGKPDLARSQYRLALVLYEQRCWKDAVTFEEAALSSLTENDRDNASDCDGRSRKDIMMQLLDRRV